MSEYTLSQTEQRFYCYAVQLARFRDHTYFGSDGRAAHELGLSRKTIIRCRASLERKGYLERCGKHRWPGGKTTVCYRFKRRRVPQRSRTAEKLEKNRSSSLRSSLRRSSGCAGKPSRRRWQMTEGQQLVAFYVDECLEQGKPKMELMKGHVGRRAKELLDAGASVEEVKAALHEFVRRGAKSPLALAEICTELARNETETPGERPIDKQRASEWIEEHGWPTGARWVRAEHAGTYVFDPLGTERLPMDYEGWPYSRPTFDQIAQALAELEAHTVA